MLGNRIYPHGIALFVSSSIVVGGLSAIVQTELSTQNYQQKSN